MSPSLSLPTSSGIRPYFGLQPVYPHPIGIQLASLGILLYYVTLLSDVISIRGQALAALLSVPSIAPTMSQFPDYYKLLNISRTATQDEVRQGYRKESLKQVLLLK